jgi:hypothetical protein
MTRVLGRAGALLPVRAEAANGRQIIQICQVSAARVLRGGQQKLRRCHFHWNSTVETLYPVLRIHAVDERGGDTAGYRCTVRSHGRTAN